MKEVYRGEIYYATLEDTVGSEQAGHRPVLILQNNAGNLHSPTTIVAAITSKVEKAHLPTDVKIAPEFLPKPSYVILGQLRTIDKLRLGDCVGKLNRKTMRKIDHGVAVSLGLK